MNPADVQAAFCAVLCDEWARAGVTDAVVAPGSRSTPMVAALDHEERIRVTVVLDERSAGFTALGMGLATARPAVVVTTSGTASVELHPSVVEAGQAGVPMIAVTTDRPPELHHVGAPQTVEQGGLFAAVVRWRADPGVPDPASAGSWRSLAARCFVEAVGGARAAGPVHLNLPLREPLLGDPERFPAPPGRAGGDPWHRPAAHDEGVLDAGVAELLAAHAGGRGIIVAGAGSSAAGAAQAGGGPPDALLRLAARLDWPVLADPRSAVRVPGQGVVAAADSLLRAGVMAERRPQVVLRAGRPWASKVLGRWLAALDRRVPQIVLDPFGAWPDPDRTAAVVVPGGAGALDRALEALAVHEAPESSWSRGWATAEDAAQGVFDRFLGPGGELEMSEPALARAVAAGVPDGGVLVVSSSMPVRDVEWYGRPRWGVTVLSNRGANGIDGVVSTAIGAAVSGGAPTVALVGDLAFLYDAGSLLWAGNRQVRLSVVVVDNCGGGIFSFLPQAEALPPDVFERYWGTPHSVDLSALASVYGAASCRIADRAALDRFLAGAGSPGIRVGVVRSDRAANVAAHDILHRAVAEEVGRALAGLPLSSGGGAAPQVTRPAGIVGGPPPRPVRDVPGRRAAPGA